MRTHTRRALGVPHGTARYAALYRLVARPPRRRRPDALDCERGPMPDDGAQDEPYEPVWCAWVPMAVAAVLEVTREDHR